MNDQSMPPEAASASSRSDEGEALDPIAEAADEMLDGMEPKRRRAIEAEARRLRARLLSIPWYAAKEKRRGARCWIVLALSYGGED